MAHQNLILITSAFGEQAARQEDTPERRLRASMLEVLQNNIYCLSEDDLFVAAVTGAWATYEDGTTEHTLIRDSLNVLKTINTMFSSGVCLPIDELQKNVELSKSTLPLMRYWHEAKLLLAH